MYIVRVPIERGKYRPGEILPENYQVDKSWIESGIVEKKAVKTAVKIKLKDKESTK